MTTDHRTGMEVLDEDGCWELIARSQVGRLAIAVANLPDIFPVNHVVDGRTIVFRSAEGTKLAAAVLGMGVAFEVDGYDPEAGEAWSVVIKGSAEELDHLADVLHAEDLPLFPWHASPKARWVRIVPAEITGRRFSTVGDQAPGR